MHNLNHANKIDWALKRLEESLLGYRRILNRWIKFQLTYLTNHDLLIVNPLVRLRN